MSYRRDGRMYRQTYGFSALYIDTIRVTVLLEYLDHTFSVYLLFMLFFPFYGFLLLN